MDCSRYRGARLARKKCDFYDRRRRDPTRYAYTLSWQLAKVTDALGNETEITKERRGLEQESGSCTYGYDALGRLSEIQKEGQMQTRYGYDSLETGHGKNSMSMVPSTVWKKQWMRQENRQDTSTTDWDTG